MAQIPFSFKIWKLISLFNILRWVNHLPKIMYSKNQELWVATETYLPIKSDLLGILGTINTFISVLYVLLNKKLGPFVSRVMFPTLLDKNLHFQWTRVGKGPSNPFHVSGQFSILETSDRSFFQYELLFCIQDLEDSVSYAYVKVEFEIIIFTNSIELPCFSCLQ